MARPRKRPGDRRSVTLRFTVRPDESVRILAAAKAAGRTPSQYLRTMALEGRVEIIQTRKLDPAITDQVRRLGVNLNQLVRITNRDGRVPVELSRLCDQIEQFLMKQIDDGP